MTFIYSLQTRWEVSNRQSLDSISDSKIMQTVENLYEYLELGFFIFLSAVSTKFCLVLRGRLGGLGGKVWESF